ncbi:MAG: LLM class flavin-dependent oxidoreductase [Acidimicrobiales bacterium]
MDVATLILNHSLAGTARAEFEARVRRLEELGFHGIAMPDSQSLFPEMYVHLAVAAMATERINIWPGTTNPLTRHPAVAASTISTVDQLAGDGPDGRGRVWFNLGSGDSAVYNLGLRGARLAATADYIRAMKGLYETGEAEWQGNTIRLKWPTRKVPIYLTAEGPKTLQMAGELADGVLVGNGLQPEIVADALENIAIGARRAGRDPAEVDVWWFVKWNMDDDKQRAIHEARMTLTASANHAFRFTLEGKHIPEEYKEAILELQRRYVFSEHEQSGSEMANATVVEELGLTDYLAERFMICGPTQEFVDKLTMLNDLGVNKVLMGFFGETDRDDKHDKLGLEVLPQLPA